MVRLADSTVLREHQARFDPACLPRTGLDPLAARRLEGLLARPYEALDARDVVEALDLVARSGHEAALVAYFLPAALRQPPLRDREAADRFLASLWAAREAPEVALWDAEIEQTLLRWLATRPLRGGDDPVDLWISATALRRRGLETARRVPRDPRRGGGLVAGWTTAAGGPPYARAALLLLARWPAAAERRVHLWEAGGDDHHLRAWLEVMFHAHGEGWRPGAPAFDAWIEAPARRAVVETLLAHPEPDVAIGAAAVGLLVLPGRARTIRAAVASRLRALDAAEEDRFVLTPEVRRLLEGT
jgi:hypothetical protein